MKRLAKELRGVARELHAARPIKSKAKKVLMYLIGLPKEWFTEYTLRDLLIEMQKKLKISKKQAMGILEVWEDFDVKQRMNIGEAEEFIHDILQNKEYTGP